MIDLALELCQIAVPAAAVRKIGLIVKPPPMPAPTFRSSGQRLLYRA